MVARLNREHRRRNCFSGSDDDGRRPERVLGVNFDITERKERELQLEAAHARLDKANFALTSIRAGRRAGTKVFTVRDGTVGVPTLVISDAAA